MAPPTSPRGYPQGSASRSDGPGAAPSGKPSLGSGGGGGRASRGLRARLERLCPQPTRSLTCAQEGLAAPVAAGPPRGLGELVGRHLVENASDAAVASAPPPRGASLGFPTHRGRTWAVQHQGPAETGGSPSAQPRGLLSGASVPHRLPAQGVAPPPTLQPGWDHGSPQRSSRGHTSPSKQACLWDTSTRALGTCTTAALAGAGQGHHPARPPRGAAPVQTPGSRTAVLRGRQAPLPAPPPLPTVRKARHWHWEGTVPQTPPRQAVSGKDWSCLKVKGWRRPGPRVDNQGRRADVGPQGSDCHLPMSSLPIPGPHPARRAPPAPAQKPKGKWVGRHLTDPTTAVGTDPQAQAHRPRARSCPG